MTPDHLSKLDEKINQLELEIIADETQKKLITDNISQNKRILKIYKEGRVKLGANNADKVNK